MGANSDVSVQVRVLLPALRADVEALPPPPDVAAALRHSTGAPSEAAPGTAASSQQCTAAAACAQQPAPAAAQRHCDDADADGSNGMQQPLRRYLTCCVRLSPEKEPDRFVAAVEVLAKQTPASASAAQAAPPATAAAAAAADPNCAHDNSQHDPIIQPDPQQNGVNGSCKPSVRSPANGAAGLPSANGTATQQLASRLQRLGVVPLLCGAADGDYADGLRSRLLAAMPEAVIERCFLSPAQLAEVRPFAAAAAAAAAAACTCASITTIVLVCHRAAASSSHNGLDVSL